MLTVLQICGVYGETLEIINDDIDKKLKDLGIDFDYSDEDVFFELEQIGNWKNITNSIIGALYSIAASLVLGKYPDADISYNVDGYCSDFCIVNLEDIKDSTYYLNIEEDVIWTKEDVIKYYEDLKINKEYSALHMSFDEWLADQEQFEEVE